MGADSYLQFVFILILFVVILALSAFATKWMAGYQKEKGLSGNIEVIETSRISPNKYIQIVRIGDKYMAIAVGKDEITSLGEVDKDSLLFRETTAEDNLNFKEVFEKFKSELKK